MKELKEIKKKGLSYEVKLDMAIKMRDFSEIVRINKVGEYEKFDYTVEAFNNRDFQKKPDKIGITIFYPSKEFPTHVITRIFSSNIGEVGFGKQVESMFKHLKEKIPRELWESLP